MRNIICKGSSYEIGFQRGEALKKEHAFLLAQRKDRSEKRKAYALACEAVYREYDPDIIFEIKGMCDALAYPYEKMRTFLFAMYALNADVGCSCIALCHEGKAMLGRNSDFLKEIAPYTLHECIKKTGGYAYAGNTTAFMEMEDGLNECGLAVGLTYIRPHRIKPGYHAGMLVRHLLTNCASVEEAIAECHRLPIGSSMTVTLADANGSIALIECNCDSICVQKNHPVVYALNRYHLKDMMDYRLPETLDDLRTSDRMRTIETAIRNHAVHDLAFVRNLLRGDYGFLCQYPSWCPADTLWSVIYVPKDHNTLLCDGNPARRPYELRPCKL